MSDKVKVRVTCEIEVDANLFTEFYKVLSTQADTPHDPEEVGVHKLVEDFIACQDIYAKESKQQFNLERLGLELTDSYSYIEMEEDV